jgi:hypothetical protein
MKTIGKIIWVSILSIAMAFVESAVVVYLRAIYYPEGFSFPLTHAIDGLIRTELLREAATIFMLLSVSILAARKLWERFAYFLLCFSVWDIFYYVWLKALLDWPATLFEWDVLFLIPIPWIGPVIAPVSVSLLMVLFSLIIIDAFKRGYDFRPTLISKILALSGCVVILYSFMRDTGAALHQQPPQPYLYELLIAGILFFAASFIISYLKTVRKGMDTNIRED